MNPRYPSAAARADYRCEYCHAPEAAFNPAFEVEPSVPVVRKGEDAEPNLALSCRSCNARKSTRIHGLDLEEVVALFHPRQDLWHQHFTADAEKAFVEGLTPTGRATVACLNMNSAAQCAARRHWMWLGLFP